MVREFPIVVEAALVLVFLNLVIAGLAAGEMGDGLRDGLAVGAGDVHEDAIHVEYDEGLGGHWACSSLELGRA